MAQEINNEHLVADLKNGFDEGIKPSKVMRNIFAKYGTIRLPDMAGYYSVAFNIHRLDVLSILNEWSVEEQAGLSDDQFDVLILNIISSTTNVIRCCNYFSKLPARQ